MVTGTVQINLLIVSIQRKERVLGIKHAKDLQPPASSATPSAFAGRQKQANTITGRSYLREHLAILQTLNSRQSLP